MPSWINRPYLIVAATLAWIGIPGIYALTRKIGAVDSVACVHCGEPEDAHPVLAWGRPAPECNSYQSKR